MFESALIVEALTEINDVRFRDVGADVNAGLYLRNRPAIDGDLE